MTLPLNEVANEGLRHRLQRRRDELAAIPFRANVERGTPSKAQVALSTALLALPGSDGWRSADGVDVRNYGEPRGLRETRELFAPLVGTAPDQIIAGGNSSLSLMHDALVFSLLRGVPGGEPWTRQGDVEFLCPAPGYDRHFLMTEAYGVKMIPIPLTGAGPDMDVVEAHACRPTVKGMWCVPKYSNPTGETYSVATVRRLATMSAAPDFRIFWDNAYAIHDLTEETVKLANILDACADASNPDRALVFASTSKITFPGGGVAALGASAANIDWFSACLNRQTIGHDKVNQLRHALMFPDVAALYRHMDLHRQILRPKFEAMLRVFRARLDPDLVNWTEPKGGYFIVLSCRPGTASRAVAIAQELGVTVQPAGGTFPYGVDPEDRYLRIAPCVLEDNQLVEVAERLAAAAMLAAVEASDQRG